MDPRHEARQQRNEPLTEIIQTKEQSETHPLISPNDEFAEFELFEYMINVGQPSQVQYGYIRQGLVEGMLMFNIGVELGQIGFVLVTLALVGILKSIYAKWPSVEPISRWNIVPYTINCLAAFWTIERTVGFL